MLGWESSPRLDKSYLDQPKDSKDEVWTGDVDSRDKAFRT